MDHLTDSVTRMDTNETRKKPRRARKKGPVVLRVDAGIADPALDVDIKALAGEILARARRVKDRPGLLELGRRLGMYSWLHKALNGYGPEGGVGLGENPRLDSLHRLQEALRTFERGD